MNDEAVFFILNPFVPSLSSYSRLYVIIGHALSLAEGSAN